MKDQYTIHEIARLYGIGADSLRYYENLGLIRPRRGENGYRLYNLKDIGRLTIIRDLMQLGFGTRRIGEYLDSMNVDNTLSMLRDEQQLIRERRRELEESERAILSRMELLRRNREQPAGEASLEELPQRPCIRLNTDIRRDEEFDFAIKKLHRMHDDTVRDLGSQTVGASISLTDLEQGTEGLFRSVFVILPPEAPNFDFLIPGGRYARIFYRGSYRQCGGCVKQLRDWVRARGLAERGDILEIYRIDNRYTAREEEFLTELQVRVEER